MDRAARLAAVTFPDGYDFTFTCGLGEEQQMCDYRTRSSRDLLVNVVAGETPPASPVAVAPPSLLGTPVVGETLACVNGGFINQPTSLAYEWLRNGAVIPGATSTTYTLTAADLGRAVACRITATNAAGSGDATSEAVVVSNPAPAPAFTAAPPSIAAPAATTTDAKTKTVTYVALCTLARSKKAIVCNVSATPESTSFTGAIRLQGVKKATKSTKSKRGKARLTVRSSTRLKKGRKVVLTIKSGKTTKTLTVKSR